MRFVCIGEGDFDISVEMVDTEPEDAERILLKASLDSGSSLCLSRFRPLSNSAFASCSSATPFLTAVLGSFWWNSHDMEAQDKLHSISLNATARAK